MIKATRIPGWKLRDYQEEAVELLQDDPDAISLLATCLSQSHLLLTGLEDAADEWSLTIEASALECLWLGSITLQRLGKHVEEFPQEAKEWLEQKWQPATSSLRQPSFFISAKNWEARNRLIPAAVQMELDRMIPFDLAARWIAWQFNSTHEAVAELYLTSTKDIRYSWLDWPDEPNIAAAKRQAEQVRRAQGDLAQERKKTLEALGLGKHKNRGGIMNLFRSK